MKRPERTPALGKPGADHQHRPFRLCPRTSRRHILWADPENGSQCCRTCREHVDQPEEKGLCRYQMNLEAESHLSLRNQLPGKPSCCHDTGDEGADRHARGSIRSRRGRRCATLPGAWITTCGGPAAQSSEGLRKRKLNDAACHTVTGKNRDAGASCRAGAAPVRSRGCIETRTVIWFPTCSPGSDGVRVQMKIGRIVVSALVARFVAVSRPAGCLARPVTVLDERMKTMKNARERTRTGCRQALPGCVTTSIAGMSDNICCIFRTASA